MTRRERPLSHPDDLRVVGGAELRWWRSSKPGMSYKSLFYKGEMVAIDPGVQDIVRFLNEEMGLVTRSSSDEHGGKEAYVEINTRHPREARIEPFLRDVIGKEFGRKGRTYYSTNDDTTLIAKFGHHSLTIIVRGNMVRGWNEWKARFRNWFTPIGKH